MSLPLELSVHERRSELEGIIERGLATFVEVGQALLEIREQRLYRETHDSFETYCRERWGFNRQRASQIIQAAEVSNMLDSPPSNARQAAELARLKDEPETIREVWSEVTDAKGDKVTAADVREAVDRRLGITRTELPRRMPTPDFVDDYYDDVNQEWEQQEAEPVPLNLDPPSPANSRQAAMLQAVEKAGDLLAEPENERAFYALGQMAFWVRFDPDMVADASAQPAQDAPDYEEIAVWATRVASGIRARAAKLRAVK